MVTGALGFAGTAAAAVFVYQLFCGFSFWKLSLAVMGLPGAATFLFYAFHRERQSNLSGFDGSGAAALARVTWPRPTKPPGLVAAAAEVLPREASRVECRGTPKPNDAASPNGGPGKHSGNSGFSGGAPLVS